MEIAGEWWGAPGSNWQWTVQPAHGIDRATGLAATARAPAQRRVVEALWPPGPVRLPFDLLHPEADLLEGLGVSRSVMTALATKRLIVRQRSEVAVVAEPAWRAAPDGAGTFSLTSAQQWALARIEEALGVPSAKPILVHGVTGSGKTEVYLRAARSVLRRGRCALLLVPEIGLTPQLEHRARAALREHVVVLHSGLADRARRRAWWQARREQASVVIGPRSAVFAPLPNIGLIVIDEEQDGAYKQEERPRYHGRDAALARAALENATVVMGSATPAVETYHHAESGHYQLARLPHRVRARPLPQVEVVDMRQEWRSTGRRLLSARLESGLADRLRRREQTLILLNRRGFAAAMMCRACGTRVECTGMRREPDTPSWRALSTMPLLWSSARDRDHLSAMWRRGFARTGARDGTVTASAAEAVSRRSDRSFRCRSNSSSRRSWEYSLSLWQR